jgi:hypothetical protein
MDEEHRLLQWNSSFQISHGKLVCRYCLAGQGLMDAEQAFLHTSTASTIIRNPSFRG